MPGCKFVKSIDHPDFKRLWALQNLLGNTKHQGFLIHGGRPIKAALDAGYALLEIWVPDSEWRTSSKFALNEGNRADVVAVQKQKLDKALTKTQMKTATLEAAAVALGEHTPHAAKAAAAAAIITTVATVRKKVIVLF